MNYLDPVYRRWAPSRIRQGVHLVRLPYLMLKVQDYSIEIALDRRDSFTRLKYITKSDKSKRAPEVMAEGRII